MTDKQFARLCVTALTTFVLTLAMVSVGAAPKRPPRVPTNPFPATGATGVSTQVTLTCSAQFATMFELYFDDETYRTANKCGFLVVTAPGTAHRWHVRALNQYGATLGPEWTFTTAQSTPPPPPPPPSGVGATLDLHCPTDGSAVIISAGQDPANVVDATWVAGTTFCFRGNTTYYPSHPIYPRTNMTFYGELGARISGQNVFQDWDIASVAIFRAHNCAPDCAGVTVRNLIFQDMPAIPANDVHWPGGYGSCMDIGWGPDQMVLDHLEAWNCNAAGFNLSASTGLHATFLWAHGLSQCTVGGYQPQHMTIEDSLFENGWSHECKFADAGDMTIRRSTFRGVANGMSALWFDTSGYYTPHTCHLIEDVTIEGASDWPAIDIEAVHCLVWRRGSLTMANTATAGGMWITNSSHVTVDGMTFNSATGGGVAIFYDGRPLELPVTDNLITHSTFNLGGSTHSVGLQCAIGNPDCYNYLSTNNNRFESNTYHVPNLSGAYWYINGPLLTWSQWQSAGFDVTSTIQQ